jgi:ComF family protein
MAAMGILTKSLLPRKRFGIGLARLGRAALDALLPPRCLKCGAMVGEPGTLCPGCWSKVAFIAPPVCAACGYPFEFAAGEDALCGACMRERPAFARARAAIVYDDASRPLILAFKHGDRTDAAPAFARWLARAGGELIDAADLIVPVPLHWMRLFRRRYNQAALLGGALAKLTHRPMRPDVLRRRRATPSQGRLGREARLRNVRGAFALARTGRARLEGRRVLLVDDVLTTGATVSACAEALLGGGASAVDVLTLARVVRPQP